MRAFGLLLFAACGSRTALSVEDDRGSGSDAAPKCGAPVPGTMRFTADDQSRLFVNGSLVDTKSDKWWNVRTITLALHVGHNSVAVEATNVWSQDGLDRGFIAELRVNTVVESSDTLWRVSKVFAQGWENPSFDASGWHHAVNEARDGAKPYGSVLGSERAWWLWSYDSNEPTAKKAGMETIWLRYDFWIEPNGSVSTSLLDCP